MSDRFVDKTFRGDFLQRIILPQQKSKKRKILGESSSFSYPTSECFANVKQIKTILASNHHFPRPNHRVTLWLLLR
ncbi:hypothetical protein FJU10_18130 [Enterococcus sp. OL5]|nr:hypothetical protein FJU10_18130 [Enterococcus sp. OL5]